MAKPDLELKAGDRRPFWRVEMTDSLGNLVDLNASDVSSVTFSMVTKQGREVVIDDQAVTIIQSGNGGSASNRGVAEYHWAEGETDDPGTYYGDFKVTYDDGTFESYPNNTSLELEIHPAIGD